MLKHASITRPNRPQPFQNSWNELENSQSDVDQLSDANNNISQASKNSVSNSDEETNNFRTPSPQQIFSNTHLMRSQSPAESCTSHNSFSSTRLPASFISTIKRNCVGSLPTTPLKSRLKAKPINLLPTLASAAPQQAPPPPPPPLPPPPLRASQLSSDQQCNSDSMIKVFAQTLNQDIEYVTLHVNAQTKSQQIIKNLLKKFRLKHRDPNLFHLTLERFIRKDGLKCKTTMLLGDEACPLQYQQCCSVPPYNDIKFTLQARTGVLIKIFCSEVVPETRYKCLSLSTQTTVEETIELMLHCLNLVPSSQPAGTQTSSTPPRQASSPSSTGSSSNSTNSSSSGIDSDLLLVCDTKSPTTICQHKKQSSFISQHPLNSNSRTNSDTSISSTSNVSTLSTSTIDQYCLIIECKDSNYKRILDLDEYLVDVYQSLVTEAKERAEAEQRRLALSSIELSKDQMQQSADQWFFIKLKRRHDISHHPNAISFARQFMPLPPIPSAISQQLNTKPASELQCIVSTTQIDVQQRRPSSSLATSAINEQLVPKTTEEKPKNLTDGNSTNNNTTRVRNPPPPAVIVLPPLVMPRRRNLSNASSTFRPHRPAFGTLNRRRYDPAQLEADLSRLDMASEHLDESSGMTQAMVSALAATRESLDNRKPSETSPN